MCSYQVCHFQAGGQPPPDVGGTRGRICCHRKKEIILKIRKFVWGLYPDIENTQEKPKTLSRAPAAS